MTFEEIAALVTGHPPIEQCFLQHQIGLDHKVSGKIPGGGGSFNYRDELEEKFRVVLWTEDRKKMADEESPCLITAVRAAYDRIGVPPPRKLPAIPEPTLRAAYALRAS